MVRVLNVAEKNDAAKSISDVMSNGRYRKVGSWLFPKLAQAHTDNFFLKRILQQDFFNTISAK
jgi:hypothetical protein